MTDKENQSTSPPLIFSVETSSNVCSVAVCRGGQFLAEHSFRHGMHLSERLIGHIDNVLSDADNSQSSVRPLVNQRLTLASIDVFAVGIGPGSFTGTRIGVMTIKTLAQVLEKPVIGISGLEALALEYAGLKDTLVVPMLPCRTGVVYTAAYSVETGFPHTAVSPDALTLAELASLLAEQKESHLLFLCAGTTARYREELSLLLKESGKAVSFGRESDPRAAMISQLAWQRVLSGENLDDAMTLVPLYISPPPITLPKTGIPAAG